MAVNFARVQQLIPRILRVHHTALFFYLINLLMLEQEDLTLSFPITKENFKKLFYKNNYDFNFV